MLDALVALVVPPRCAACAGPAPTGRRLCRRCHAELPWLRDACERCALPRPCGPPCPAARAAFSAAWAPLAFEGPARALVHALKFRGRTAAAQTMAAQIAANAPPALLREAAALVPVPAHPGRRRERGFDHARILSRALSRRTGVPTLDVLSHTGAPARQLGAGREQRRRSGSRFSPRSGVEGVVLVVDDVHTTGATLDACARALLEAGAAGVAVATYARTLG